MGVVLVDSISHTGFSLPTVAKSKSNYIILPFSNVIPSSHLSHLALFQLNSKLCSPCLHITAIMCYDFLKNVSIQIPLFHDNDKERPT